LTAGDGFVNQSQIKPGTKPDAGVNVKNSQED